MGHVISIGFQNTCLIGQNGVPVKLEISKLLTVLSFICSGLIQMMAGASCSRDLVYFTFGDAVSISKLERRVFIRICSLKGLFTLTSLQWNPWLPVDAEFWWINRSKQLWREHANNFLVWRRRPTLFWLSTRFIFYVVLGASGRSSQYPFVYHRKKVNSWWVIRRRGLLCKIHLFSWKRQTAHRSLTKQFQ